MSFKTQIKRLLTFTRQGPGITDYDQFYEKSCYSDASVAFTTENTSIYLMKLVGDEYELKGSSLRGSESERLHKKDDRHKRLCQLMFGSYAVQKHDGMSTKIHVLESKEEIYMTFVFLDDRQTRRKERSPNTSGYGSLRSGSLNCDYHERSMEDELQSSVNSVGSIASSIASLASSLGIHSLSNGARNGHRDSTATTPDQAVSSSIPTESCLSHCNGTTGLKRVSSSPSKLAAEGVQSSWRQLKFGIGVLFKSGHKGLDFGQLKDFIFSNVHVIETQVMVCRKVVFDLLDRGEHDHDQVLGRVNSDYFIFYLNMVLSGRRISNLWQCVNLGGLVGSRVAKNNVADLICDLYYQYEGEKRFLSTVVTGVLSANSTWHGYISEGAAGQGRCSAESHRFLDLYGGKSSNFPVRVAFISQEVGLLQGFLALTTFFMRNTIFVKNDLHKKARFVPVDSSDVSVSDLPDCRHNDKIATAVQSAASTGTLTLLCEGEGERDPLEASRSNDTLTSTTTNSSLSVGPGELGAVPRYCTSFVDYALSKRLSDKKLMVDNQTSLPLLTPSYHPSSPVMGLMTPDGVYKDFKCGFAAQNEALRLSISEEVVPKMVVNNATSFDCQFWVHDGTYQNQSRITSSSAVARIIKNFVELKQLTGNSKLCLVYLESELQTLGNIRQAYLTFCALEASPPHCFLDVFNMDKSDGEFFNLIKK